MEEIINLNIKSSKGEYGLKNQDKIIKFLNESENPYILKVEDMVVEFQYSDVKKTFNECIKNILKQKKRASKRYSLKQRETRFELATLALARRCSTTEPLAHKKMSHSGLEPETPGLKVQCSTN